MKIERIDSNSARIERLEVVRRGRVWRLPSHDDYPADAKDQVHKAALTVMDLSGVTVADGQHEQYGVLEPTAENYAKAGSEALGMRVTLGDKSATFADLVIGKPVPEREGLRYVRVVGQQRVMSSKISTDALTTKFSSWIETDLLKLGSSRDVKRVHLRDYTLDADRGRLQDRARMTFKYDVDKSAWTVEDLRRINEKRKELVKDVLAEDEEPNGETLDKLRDTLADLKIVNVYKKPAPLKKWLESGGKEGKFGEAEMQSLADRGFFLVPSQEQENALVFLSSEGEAIATTDAGIQYVLRFGKVESADTSGRSQAAKNDSADNKGEDKKDDGDDKEQVTLNRFLYVEAQFDPDLIPMPKYESLPAETTPMAETNGEKKPQAASTTAPAASGSTGGAGDASSQEKPADTESKTDKPADEAPTAPGISTLAFQGDEKQADAQSPPSTEAKPEGTEKKPDEKPSEAAKSDEKKPDAAKPAEAAKTPDPKEAERKRITEENERKKKEYEDKIKEGEKKVKELNARFADWYYVIGEDMYKKIHLSRADVIKKKEKKEEAKDDATKPATPATPPAAPATTDEKKDDPKKDETKKDDAPTTDTKPADEKPASANPAEKKPADQNPSEKPASEPKT
jgi:hypothetical protein